jgi:hypothetical protein
MPIEVVYPSSRPCLYLTVLTLPLLAPLGLSKARRRRRCSFITISLIPSDGRKYSCVERDSSRIERGSPRVELGFSCIERGCTWTCLHLLAFCPRHWRRILESQLISRCVRVYQPFLHARDCILRIRSVKGHGIYRLRPRHCICLLYEYLSLLFCKISGVSESANSLAKDLWRIG